MRIAKAGYTVKEKWVVYHFEVLFFKWSRLLTRDSLAAILRQQTNNEQDINYTRSD